MSLPWTPEEVLAPELALELIREQFPELAPVEARLLGSGWDNTAYLIDGALVFRFPRRALAVGLLEREAQVLPRLAPRLPLAVPLPEWAGRPTSRFGWPFLGYRRLAGTPASEAAPTAAQSLVAARALAAFLRALHHTPPEELGLPGDEIGRLDIGVRLVSARERLQAIVARGVVADAAPWHELFAGELPVAGPEHVVVHGDLYARHLLLDGSGTLSGVIDWGDVHASDPAVDLMVAWSFFRPGARARFLEAYGAVSARTLRLARLRAAGHTIALLW